MPFLFLFKILIFKKPVSNPIRTSSKLRNKKKLNFEPSLGILIKFPINLN